MSNPQNEKKMGLAIAGFVVSILAILGSALPIINNISFIFAIISFIFGVISLISIKKGKGGGKGLAIATVIISVLTFIIVLVTQSMYSKAVEEAGKALDETSNKINKTFDDASGKNTEQLLKDSVDVEFGQFNIVTEDYITKTELPVTVKNKSSEKASFTIKVEAVSSTGERIADDVLYLNSLNAGQSQSEKMFQFVDDSKLEAIKSATFKILEVGKSTS